MDVLATAAAPDFLGTVLGALPELGGLGAVLALLALALRWTASERAAWRAERAELVVEIRDLRAELRARDSGSRPPSLPSG